MHTGYPNSRLNRFLLKESAERKNAGSAFQSLDAMASKAHSLNVYVIYLKASACSDSRFYLLDLVERLMGVVVQPHTFIEVCFVNCLFDYCIRLNCLSNKGLTKCTQARQ